MGSMAFLLPNQLPAGADALLPLACLASGYDLTPAPTVVQIDSGRLVLSRDIAESGYLVVPWPVGPRGAIVCMSSTLREGVREYSFLNELSRGKLNQVRVHAAEWTERGLETPPDFDRELAHLTRRFGNAVLAGPSPESDAAVVQVLVDAFALADRLVRLYIEQLFKSRREEEGRLSTWLTARYSASPTGESLDCYRQAFNAARIAVRWRDVEPVEGQYHWGEFDRAVEVAETARLPVSIGPVIDLGPGMLPDWLGRWSGDLPTIAAFMCDYLETMMARYHGRVDRWVVCSGFNHADNLGLNDDDRLRLAARLFEAAAQAEDDRDLVVGLAQPWGDYLVQDDQTISPFAFADDLIRAGLRVTAIEVDLRTGSRPRGSWPRDLLDTSRLLELYGRLGLPVDAVLSHPSSSRDDPAARAHHEEIWRPSWRGEVTPELQEAWGEAFVALALCNPLVRTVTWDSWSDADPHLTPWGGLVQTTGAAKPLLARLSRLRSEELAAPPGN